MQRPSASRSASEPPAGGSLRSLRLSRQDRSRLGRLFRWVRPYRGSLAAALAGILAGSALSLAGPVAMRYLVDAIVPGGRPELLGTVTLVLFGIFLLQALVRVLSGYLLAYVGERVVVDLRLRLYHHLQGLDLTFFAHRRTGELVSRLTNDVSTVRSLVTDDTASGLSQALLFAGSLALLVATDWRLTAVMLALVPAVLLLAILFGRRLRRLSSQVQDELAEATTVLEESITGVRVVQSFHREEHERGRYRSRLETSFGLAMRRTRLAATFGPLISLLFTSATVALLWYGGRLVLEGHLSPGQLVTFLVLTMMIAGSIGQLSSLWTRLQQTLGASQRLFELLDTPARIHDLPGAQELGEVAGRLTFEHVSFRYPERPSGGSGSDSGEPAGEPDLHEAREEESAPRPFALEDISLDIEAGEILALVGPSGAGKSTLIQLVPRFYDPTAGRVLLDGQDLREVALLSLREQIGIVPQDTYLFGGTVRENLAYGKLDASQEELEAAARAANAHDFIRALPQGYETVVGERGVRLSTGQRQRLTIARALLKDPRVLLLDEATSSLDSESEDLVREALERLMEGRTSIVIAHRLSTVRRAHRIAVLDHGRLVELGSREELLARGGLFTRLYELQFYEEQPAPALEPREGHR